MGLLNSSVLDVAIGLIFVYLLLSILCTAANESIAAITKRRPKMLERGLRLLLGNQQIGGKLFVDAFYKHPLIDGLRDKLKDGSVDKSRHPAYLAPRTVTAVVTDLLTATKPGAIEFKDLEEGAKALEEGPVRTSVLALVQRSGGDLEVAQKAIEGWFNDSMDRVSGWYKRNTQIWTFIIAVLLTVVANADTIMIAKRLWADPVLRSAVVEEAKVRAQKPRPTVTVEYEDDGDPTKPTVTRSEGNEVSAAEREVLGQLIGWRGNLPEPSLLGWLERLLGWFLTALALSMGAPFWFDILNKFMNVRLAGKSPDEGAKPPEPDRAPNPAKTQEVDSSAKTQPDSPAKPKEAENT
jgi:hypothetical protein